MLFTWRTFSDATSRFTELHLCTIAVELLRVTVLEEMLRNWSAVAVAVVVGMQLYAEHGRNHGVIAERMGTRTPGAVKHI